MSVETTLIHGFKARIAEMQDRLRELDAYDEGNTNCLYQADTYLDQADMWLTRALYSNGDYSSG